MLKYTPLGGLLDCKSPPRCSFRVHLVSLAPGALPVVRSSWALRTPPISSEGHDAWAMGALEATFLWCFSSCLCAPSHALVRMRRVRQC